MSSLPGLWFFCFLMGDLPAHGQGTELSNPGLHLIPYPPEVKVIGEAFTFPEKIVVVIDKNALAEDRSTAGQFIRSLKEEFGIEAAIGR